MTVSPCTYVCMCRDYRESIGGETWEMGWYKSGVVVEMHGGEKGGETKKKKKDRKKERKKERVNRRVDRPVSSPMHAISRPRG